MAVLTKPTSTGLQPGSKNSQALNSISQTGRDSRGRRVGLSGRVAAQSITSSQSSDNTTPEATINQNPNGSLQVPVASVQQNFSPVPQTFTPTAQPVATSVFQPARGGGLGYANIPPLLKQQNNKQQNNPNNNNGQGNNNIQDNNMDSGNHSVPSQYNSSNQSRESYRGLNNSSNNYLGRIDVGQQNSKGLLNFFNQKESYYQTKRIESSFGSPSQVGYFALGTLSGLPQDVLDVGGYVKNIFNKDSSKNSLVLTKNFYGKILGESEKNPLTFIDKALLEPFRENPEKATGNLITGYLTGKVFGSASKVKLDFGEAVDANGGVTNPKFGFVLPDSVKLFSEADTAAARTANVEVSFKAGLEEFRPARGAVGEIIESRFSAPQKLVQPTEVPPAGAIQNFRLSRDTLGREVLTGNIVQTGSIKGILKGKPFESDLQVQTSFSGITETPGEFVIAGKQTQTFNVPKRFGSGMKAMSVTDQLSGAFDFNQGYGLFLKDEGVSKAIIGKETGSYFEITNVEELARVARGKRFVELDEPYSILTKKSRVNTGELFSSDSVTVRGGEVVDYGKSLTQLRSEFNKIQRAEVISNEQGFSYGPVSKRGVTVSEGVANEFEGGVILKPSLTVEKGRALGLRTGILQRAPTEVPAFEFGLKIKEFNTNFLKVLQKEPSVKTFQGEPLFTGKPDFSLLTRNVAKLNLESVRVATPTSLSDLRQTLAGTDTRFSPLVFGFYKGNEELQSSFNELRSSPTSSVKAGLLSGIKYDYNIKVNSESDLRQDNRILLRQNSRSSLRQNPRSDLRQNPRSDTRVESKLDNKLDSRLSQRQDTRLDTRLASRLQSRLNPRLNVSTSIKFPESKPPKVESDTDDSLYRVLVGRKGRKYFFDLGVGGEKLLARAKALAQNTAARTITVKRINGGANADLAREFGKSFYGNKNGQFVQNVKDSINSSGEKAQIPGQSHVNRRVKQGLNAKRFRY